MILSQSPRTIVRRYSTREAAWRYAARVPGAVVLLDTNTGAWCVAAPVSFVGH